MKYFVDSSVIIGAGLSLASSKLHLLQRYGQLQHVPLITTEVVIEECVNKFETELVTSAEAASGAISKVSRLIGQEFINLFSIGETARWVGSYRSQIESIFDGYNSKIRPYPKVAHQDIALRAMRSRRPYRKGEKDGYRDTLIWYSILEELYQSDERIVFLTNNMRDFAEGEKLHPELADELVTLGYGPDAVTIMTSFNTVAKEYLQERIKQIAETKEEIISGKWQVSNIQDDVVEAITRSIVHDQLSRWLTDTTGAGIDIEVIDILDVRGVGIVDVDVIQDIFGGFTIHVRVLADIELEVEISGHELAPTMLREVAEEGADWALGTAFYEVPFLISLSFDAEWTHRSSAAGVHASPLEVVWTEW